MIIEDHPTQKGDTLEVGPETEMREITEIQEIEDLPMTSPEKATEVTIIKQVNPEATTTGMKEVIATEVVRIIEAETEVQATFIGQSEGSLQELIEDPLQGIMIDIIRENLSKDEVVPQIEVSIETREEDTSKEVASEEATTEEIEEDSEVASEEVVVETVEAFEVVEVASEEVVAAEECKWMNMRSLKSTTSTSQRPSKRPSSSQEVKVDTNLNSNNNNSPNLLRVDTK
jgi:hypothetical protein